MKFTVVLFLIFTNLLFLQSCSAQTATISTADYKIIGGKSSTVLPFELFDNRQMLKVKINGQGPFKFGVDTGGRNLVTPEVPKKLGLKLTDQFQTSGAGEKRVSAWWTQVEKVELGEIVGRNQRFVVLSLEDIKNAIGFKEFDGLLGRELFESLTTKIDFEDSEFIFTDPEKFEYRGTGEIIPFKFAGSIPEITGEIDGIEGKIIVDTGDRSSLTLFVPFYETNNFREKYPDRKNALTGWGVGGAIPAEMIRLEKIKVGDVILENVITRLPLVKSGAFARSNQIGSIGSGLLKRFNVTFDYRRKRLILEKNKNFRYEDNFKNYVLDDYQTLLKKGIEHDFPGFILGVKDKDGKTRINSAGVKSIENQTPMKPDERFHIASITKIFTATAVLKLIDKGKFSLDTKVVDILDKKLVAPIPYIEEITVSQLLDHSSGIYGFNNDKEYIETWLGKRVKENVRWSPEKFVSLAYGDRVKPFGKPGTGNFYGDTNYVLLGLIVEKVTGKSFRQFVTKEIFRPLEMKDTAFYGEEKNVKNFELPITVQGYLKRSEILDSVVTLDARFKKVNENLINTTSAVEKIDAGAGIVSTAADLLKFGRAFYGGKLLSPRMMKWFFKFGEGIEKEPVGTNRQAITTIHHKKYGIFYASSGDSPSGINATLVYHPKSEKIIVAFTNIFGLFDEIDLINDEIIKEIIE